MSYKLERHRILAGSLNLLPPGDKIPADDALELENWRMDQAGALRSRLGVAATASPWGVIVTAHSFGRRANDIYIGSSIYLMLYGHGASPISSSGDGKPFFFAAMNGAMWVMNRGLQNSYVGAVAGGWGIGAPAAAPGLGFVAGDSPLTGGVYQWYYTYTAGGNGFPPFESNPSPVSISTDDGAPIVEGFSPTLTVPASTDSRVTGINLYRSGGTLGQPYRVQKLAVNTNFTFVDELSDEDATTLGIGLETDHDPPPAASGMAGPYFGRLMAWSSAAHPNRLWWTPALRPDFFPGSADDVSGQWVDVGDDGEAILNVTLHTRVAIIYKETSIWRLSGDPDTGTLEQTKSKVGLQAVMAVVNAGGVDYFMASGGEGLHRFDLDSARKISARLDPLFEGKWSNTSLITGVAPIDPSFRSLCALELANGQLYLSYPPAGSDRCRAALVYHIESERFGRHTYFGGGEAFGAMLYPAHGGQFWGASIYAQLFALNQGTTDAGEPIHLAFQSRYHDQGHPENDKVYTSLVIEYQALAPDNVAVELFYNNGSSNELVLYLVGAGAGLPGDSGPRQTSECKLDEANGGKLARNISLRLTCAAVNQVVIHSMTLYYYVEGRLTQQVATIPLDFGTNQVKQVRELQLDMATPDGVAEAKVSSDLPGNALTVRDTRTIAASIGRRNFNLPLAATYEGRLLRLTIASAFRFRLYAARLLMRVMGVYVEAYESLAGFVWSSHEQAFGTNLIKSGRELEIDIDTRGADVVATLLTEMPGNALAVRYTQLQLNSGAGRAPRRLVLPAGVEGRLYELRLSGSATYVLYGARIELLAVGVYVEGYEATAGAVYDSREIDLGSPRVKEARELELDIDTAGCTVKLLSDLPGLGAMTQVYTTTVTSSGRQVVPLPLTAFPEGRLWQLIISGTAAFRFYGARLKARAIGTYVTADLAGRSAIWDSTELDFGTPQVKQFRSIELELATYGAVTATLFTDLPGDIMASRVSSAVVIAAQGRRTLQIPLPQGAVPDNHYFGRLLRLTLSGAGAYKLFRARVEYRAIGVYVEAYEAQGGAVWDSGPLDLGVPRDKVFDQLRLELDADGAVSVTVWTDLPGETLTVRFTATISTAGFGRRFVTMPLPVDTHGRLIKVVVGSAAAFRLYRGAVSRRVIGRYLAAGVSDTYRSLDVDFGTERVKLFKYLEADIQTDGELTLTLYTDGPGPLAVRYTAPVSTSGARRTVKFRLPGNVRGRLARIEIGGAFSGRLYGLRAWAKTTGEPSNWTWVDFPVEKSEALAEWAELPIAPTPAEFQWADLPVDPTPAEFQWASFPVAGTPAQWGWASFPVEETPDTWKWVDVPIGEE